MKKVSSLINNFFFNIDGLLFASLSLIILIGCFAIYSATGADSLYSRYISVQMAAIFIGLLMMLVLTNFNYKNFANLDKFIYGLSILLLVSVLIFGTTIKGTKGWFNLGIVFFQPVEIAKILYILVLSSFLSKMGSNVKKIKVVSFSFLILLSHLILIMMQPDFSSTLSYFPITIIMLFIAGVRFRYLLVIIIFGCIAAGVPLMMAFFKFHNIVVENSSLFIRVLFSLQDGITWLYMTIAFAVAIVIIWWFCKKLMLRAPMSYIIILALAILMGCIASGFVEKSIKDYQKKRLVVFLDPTIDQRGSGYNIVQSKITIGSGGFLGKGFKHGTQTHLGFLPEQHTDFIFSVIGEEGGWLVSQLTILLYFIFLWRALVIGRNAKDSFGSFAATGIVAMFGFYAFINIGMVMGIMPVTGVPLLFISYGGSSIISSFFAVGILCSINMRKHTNYKTA